MTNPKIKVGAELDMSAIEAGLKKLKAATDDINKSFNSGAIGFDTKQAKVQLTDLAKQVETVVSAAKGANVDGLTEALEDAAKAADGIEQVFEAMGQSTGLAATVKNAKTLTDQLTRARKAQEVFNREGLKGAKDMRAETLKQRFDEVRGSGARGAAHLRGMEVDDWATGGWRRYSLSDRENERMRKNVLRRIGFDVPDQARGGMAGRTAGRLGGAIGGALTGSVTGGGLGIGTLAGAAAGMIPGVGKILGPIVGALGGLIDKALSQAISEAGDLSDLRKSLGATSVDFEDLRSSIHHFSSGMGIQYNELAKLAKQYAHTANGGPGVGQAVGSAVGFGRGFGMDPAAAVQFFATMRHYGATQGEKDNRKLSLSIAEAVTKGGVTAKADEALAAIQNYVQTSARQSLTESNVEAYASYMSSLTGLSHYGMKGDPTNASAVMGKADAALRQGGAFGEASKNFSLGIYQRRFKGFTAFDMDYLNEQGAFGTAERAFAKDSPAYKLAKRLGDKGLMGQYDQWARAGGDQTILSMQMQALEAQYGGNTNNFRKGIMTHLGVNAGEASTLFQAYSNDNGLGGLEQRLGRAGVNTTGLDAKKIAGLAEIAFGGRDVVRGQAQKLKESGELDSSEQKQLADALANGSPEELRNVVLELTALNKTTEDEGEKMRRAQAEMANALQDIATKLLPLAAGMNDKLGELVRWLAPESGAGKEFAQQQGQAETLDRQLASLKSRIEGHKPATPEQIKAHNHAKAMYEKAVKAGDKEGISHWAAEEFRTRGPVLDGKNVNGLIGQYNTALGERNSLDSIGPSVTFGKIDPVTGTMAPPEPSGDDGARLGRSGGNGPVIRRKGRAPRNVRNHNPGNIEYGPFARKHGAIGTDGRFAVFPDRETGSRAADALLQSYGKRGLNTVYKIVARWAPPSENNTMAYAQFVARKVGVGVHDHVNLNDPRVVTAIAQAKAIYEGGGEAYVASGQGGGKGRDARVPHGQGGSDKLAFGAVDHNVKVYVLDQNGKEMGNAVSQTQTRVGAPRAAGLGYA